MEFRGHHAELTRSSETSRRFIDLTHETLHVCGPMACLAIMTPFRESATWACVQRLRARPFAPHTSSRYNGVEQHGDEKMRFNVTIDRDEDGVWIVECPSIPGCVSQGATREEALEGIQEAIRLCLEVRAERGMPLTVETRQVEVLV